MKRIAVPLLAAGLLASACGHPLIPASALRPPTPAKAHQAGGGPAPRVKFQVRHPVLGVDLYAQNNYSAARTTFYGNRTLAYIAKTLKATSVGLLWNFYSPGRTSNLVGARPSTMSPANLVLLTKLAKAQGLQVEWRPLVFVPSHPTNPWEGLIDPTSQQAWFDNYFKALKPYLVAAQQQHISEFVVQTELHVLNTSPLWASFFSRVKKIYQGVVSYAAWYGDYLRGPLLPVRYYGMDMYKALNLKYSATLAQVTAAWEAVFAGMSASVLERTAFDEEGIEAREGAYKKPPNLGAPGVPDEAVQANWFTAACRTVVFFHLRGVYFFKVDLTDNPAEPASSLSTFEGRKGAVAIANCARLFN